jgi:hypothetical protein
VSVGGTFGGMHRRSLVIAGEEWVAFEVRPLADLAATEPALANGWLCFEKDSDRRRFFLIPEGWERWPDSQLVTLWRAAKRSGHAVGPAPPLPRRGREEPRARLTASDLETRVDVTSA